MNTIELSNVAKSFSRGNESISILKNLNLRAREGEKIAILGPSGSGKSTLLSLLAGLDAPDSGEVKILSKSIFNMTEREITTFRGKNLGIVFQQFHLVRALTALQNVMLPLEINQIPQAEALAIQLLERVGLGKRIHHTPSQLSGGECQRVAIARALATKPPILLADEPSGNLDEHTGEKVMDYLFKLVAEENTTLILVTHNKNLTQFCDRTLILKEGSLHEG